MLLILVPALLLGVLASRVGTGHGRVAPSVAGALLLVVVLGDLLPDALADGASSDLPGGSGLVLATAVAGAAVGLRVLRRRPAGGGGCCPADAGRVTATALATHGAAEGLVVGLGLPLGEGTAIAVTAVVAAHRLAEGYALGTALRRSRTARRTALALTGLAAGAPLLGGALAGRLTLDEGGSALVTAGLGGLLVAVAGALLGAATPAPGGADEPLRPATGLVPGWRA